MCLEASIRHHTEMFASLEAYDGEQLEAGLKGTPGPTAPMIERAHHLSRSPRGSLSDADFEDLTAFVRFALSDPEAHPDRLRSLIPAVVPSGLPVHDLDIDKHRRATRERVELAGKREAQRRTLVVDADLVVADASLGQLVDDPAVRSGALVSPAPRRRQMMVSSTSMRREFASVVGGLTR